MELENIVIGEAGVVLLIIGIIMVAVTGGDLRNSFLIIEHCQGCEFVDWGRVYGIIAAIFIGLAFLIGGGLLILFYIKKLKD